MLPNLISKRKLNQLVAKLNYKGRVQFCCPKHMSCKTLFLRGEWRLKITQPLNLGTKEKFERTESPLVGKVFPFLNLRSEKAMFENIS